MKNNVNTQTEYKVCNVGTCTSSETDGETLKKDAENHHTELQQNQTVEKPNFGNKYPELHNLLFCKETAMHVENERISTESCDIKQEEKDGEEKQLDKKIIVNSEENGLVQITNDNVKDVCNCDATKADVNASVHIPRCRFSSTYVFQCTQCPMVFVQPTSAIKHLIKIHNRPRLGLHMLREAILKRRIQLLAENNDGVESIDKVDNVDCHCAYCKKVFEHNIDLSMHLLYCSVKDIVLQRRRVHFRHHSADYIRTAIEESKREHLDPTIPLDFTEFWPISKQKLAKARQKLKQMEAKRLELLKKSTELHQEQPSKETMNEPLENNTNIVKTTVLKKLTTTKKKDISNKIVVAESINNIEKTAEKIKRKKEKRDKKEKKKKQKVENMNTELSRKENKKYKKKNKLDKLNFLLNKKKLKSKVNGKNNSNSIVTTNLDEYNSSSSLISMKSSENLESVTPPPTTTTTTTPASSPKKYNPCRCKICNKKFNGLGNVRRHISMFHYRANRFGCKLCTYRAFRRYDIVNHLGFVHKMCEARELMAVQYVIQHEVQTNLDVDHDIELLNINCLDDKEKIIITKNAVGRPRKILSVGEIKHHTNGNKPRRFKNKDMHMSTSKRPIRNRIKPVEKDFVYDEDTKDGNSTTRCLRRRHSSLTNMKSDDLLGPAFPPTNFIFTTLLSEQALPKVKGAARRSLANLVACGLAAAASAPELPRERPQMRPHVSDMNRDCMQAGRVIETEELELARLKSTLLDDTFLAAKINQIKKCSASNKNLHNFRVKPSLAKEMTDCSMTRNLLLKVNGENMAMSPKFFIKQEENCTTSSREVNAHMHLVKNLTNNNIVLKDIKQEHVEEMEEDIIYNEYIPRKRMRSLLANGCQD